jgi:hypothetical protein
MLIHKIWTLIFKTFRKRRFRLFLEKIRPDSQTRILDVGGYPQTWIPHRFSAKEIHIINVHPIPRAQDAGGHEITYAVTDGCALPFKDAEFDIGFSNSVIEHVGNWERQQKFAQEIRRTSGKLWVQTPAQEFWIEPHFMTPFIHWFSPRIRVKLARNFTVWGWLARPTAQQAKDYVDDIRLLTCGEMKLLFPDCTIFREKFLFIFTKSYIAVRV